jgi:putative membrane protein
MVVLDILIEPVAMRFNWWMWFYDAEKTQPYELLRAPAENYAAWFVIGFIIIYLLDKLRQRRTNPIAAPLLLIQFVFFGICLVLAMAGR